ncbi:MAG TPA: MnhB domain-containing protein [Candidatus Binataceae bacterium]|nr:MnhB domain-containing protein [Candidatus Binataceae bacterium]
MNHPIRTGAFFVFSAPLLALFCWGIAGLQPYGTYNGEYGIFLNQITVAVRHITNVPTAINFDFRAFDTIGEEYILYAAVIGTLILLRQLRKEQESEEDDQSDKTASQVSDRSEAIRLAGMILFGLLLTFGIYLILHGHMTPGGGFQGGAIVGTGALLVYLTAGYDVYSEISPASAMEALHSIGAGGFVIIGLAGLIVGGVFLKNVLPLGSAGQFASGGIIPVANDVVGLGVANAFAVVFHEFIVQTRRKQK